MPRDVQIAGAAGGAPQSYEVPNATEIIVRAVNATFDGTATAAAWVPTVEIISDGGVVVARCPCSTTVAAGASAECSFYPFSDEAVAVTPPSQTIDEVIFANDPWAWWKLNESAGNTAFDSSPNRFDQTVPGGGTTPTWGQAAGPPGEQTALFTGGAVAYLTDAAFAALTGDFSVMGWIKRSTNLISLMMGQGEPFGSHTGWALLVEAFNQGTGNRAMVVYGNGATAFTIEGDNAIAVGAWHFIAAVRSAGTWTLYVDGAAQTNTSAAGFVSAGSIWTARNPSLAAANDVTLSYLNVFTHALTAGEIGAIYAAA